MGAGCQLLLNEQQVLGQMQPGGQALESRGRSRTEVGISVLGATAQKPEGGF